MAHKYRELKVWQRAMDFVVDVYALTARFTDAERYGLTSQLRRAATSIPLNIAEGAGNTSDAEFHRFLRIALRSAYETSTAIEIARRLGYCTPDEASRLLDEGDHIAAMLYRLIQSTQQNPSRLREADSLYDHSAPHTDTN